MNYIILFSLIACSKQGDPSRNTTSTLAGADEKSKPIASEESKAATESATETLAETADILLQEVGFATPESVFYDKKNDRYLVSNINGNPTGADDNASAVAALLELGRRWSTAPPRRPVWLVAFDLEEWGLLGSAALAEQLRAEQQRLKLMVSLEMLAYTSESQSYPHPAMGRVYGNRGDFIALVANARAGLMLSRLTLAMGQHVKTRALPVPRAGIDVPAVRRSDHSPFWDRGYNALMVTDTSFMRNPHYHQMSDTIDTLDLPFLASVINGLEVALGTL